MMNIAEVVIIVDTILKENNQERTFTIAENKRLTATHGRVKLEKNASSGKFYPSAMEFSAAMLANATRNSIIEVIKHECAHALVTLETGENHKHNAVFKQMCKRLNCSLDKATGELEYETAPAAESIYRYEVTCSCCGSLVARYQRAGKCVKQPHLFYSKCCKANLIVKEI